MAPPRVLKFIRSDTGLDGRMPSFVYKYMTGLACGPKTSRNFSSMKSPYLLWSALVDFVINFDAGLAENGGWLFMQSPFSRRMSAIIRVVSTMAKDLVDHIIITMNDLLGRDPKAVSALVETRVYCNEAVADHPTVQVGTDKGKPTVGLLGILNGLCGTMADGTGYIAAEIGDDGRVSRFVRLDERQVAMRRKA